MTTTAGHSFYIGPIGSFYYQVNDTGSWEPLVSYLSTCHFLLTYHQVSNWINTTGTISGAGTYASGAHEFIPCFSGVHVIRSLVLCVCFVDRCLSFFFSTLCCLFVFDLQIPITPLYFQTLPTCLTIEDKQNIHVYTLSLNIEYICTRYLFNCILLLVLFEFLIMIALNSNQSINQFNILWLNNIKS
jgi:hypothetical protein